MNDVKNKELKKKQKLMVTHCTLNTRTVLCGGDM